MCTLQLVWQLSFWAVVTQDIVLNTQHQVLEDAVKAHPDLADAIVLLKVSPLPQQ